MVTERSRSGGGDDAGSEDCPGHEPHGAGGRRDAAAPGHAGSRRGPLGGPAGLAVRRPGDVPRGHRGGAAGPGRGRAPDAMGAVSLDEPGRPGAGIARDARVAGSPGTAEAAITVVDDYQGAGLGTALGIVLASVALRRGITRLRAHMLADNRRVLGLLDRVGATVRQDSPGVALAEIDLHALAGI